MDKIALIGGSGFIGTRLAKRFSQNGKFFSIFDIQNSYDFPRNHITVDVTDINQLISRVNKTSIIINLAAEHKDDVWPKSRYDEVNVSGAKNVCNLAREKKINTIIFTSSVAVYGFVESDTNENGKINPFNDYGRTKWEAEQVYKRWQLEDSKNRTLVIVRPTVVFGEGNRGNVYNLLNQIASKKFVMFGSGKNKKSMAYVENVAAFLEYSLSFKPGLHVYNYIDKPDYDMNSLISEVRSTLFNKSKIGLRLPASFGVIIGFVADFIAKIIRRNLPISSIRVKKFMNTTQFSSSLKKTGFIAPISLKHGLVKTLHYEFLEDNSMNNTFDTE